MLRANEDFESPRSRTLTRPANSTPSVGSRTPSSTKKLKSATPTPSKNRGRLQTPTNRGLRFGTPRSASRGKKEISSKPVVHKNAWNDNFTDLDKYKCSKEELIRKKTLLLSKNNIFQSDTVHVPRVNLRDLESDDDKGDEEYEKDQHVQQRGRHPSRSRPNTTTPRQQKQHQHQQQQQHSRFRSPAGENRRHSSPSGVGGIGLMERDFERIDDWINTDLANLTLSHDKVEIESVKRTVSPSRGRKPVDHPISQAVQIPTVGSHKPISAANLTTVASNATAASATATAAAAGHFKHSQNMTSPTSRRMNESFGSAERMGDTIRTQSMSQEDLAEMAIQIRSLVGELRNYEEISGKQGSFNSEEIELILGSDENESLSQIKVMRLLTQLVCQSLTHLLQTEMQLQSKTNEVKNLTERLDHLRSSFPQLSSLLNPASAASAPIKNSSHEQSSSAQVSSTPSAAVSSTPVTALRSFSSQQRHQSAQQEFDYSAAAATQPIHRTTASAGLANRENITPRRLIDESSAVSSIKQSGSETTPRAAISIQRSESPTLDFVNPIKSNSMSSAASIHSSSRAGMSNTQAIADIYRRDMYESSSMHMQGVSVPTSFTPKREYSDPKSTENNLLGADISDMTGGSKDRLRFVNFKGDSENSVSSKIDAIAQEGVNAMFSGTSTTDWLFLHSKTILSTPNKAENQSMATPALMVGGSNSNSGADSAVAMRRFSEVGQFKVPIASAQALPTPTTFSNAPTPVHSFTVIRSTPQKTNQASVHDFGDLDSAKGGLMPQFSWATPQRTTSTTSKASERVASNSNTIKIPSKPNELPLSEQSTVSRQRKNPSVLNSADDVACNDFHPINHLSNPPQGYSEDESMFSMSNPIIYSKSLINSSIASHISSNSQSNLSIRGRARGGSGDEEDADLVTEAPSSIHRIPPVPHAQPSKQALLSQMRGSF